MRPKSKLRPYHCRQETPLLQFGGDFFRIKDALEGTILFGSPGAGKTSGSFFAFLLAMLSAGFGGLFCCIKVDAVDEIRRAAKAAGRIDDLLYIDGTDTSELCNLLDCASTILGGDGFIQSLVGFVSHMIEASRLASSTGGSDGENRYFTEGALKWTFHAFALLKAAYGTIRMSDLNAFIASIPQTVAEVRSDAWKTSFCYQTHALLARRAREARAAGSPDMELERIIREHGDFFLDEVAKLDSRPKTSIQSTLTNMIYPFLAGTLARLFCTTTTVTPFAARDGKIVVLNLPTLKYGSGAEVAQVLLKFLFGIAMQSVAVTDTTRPVFIAADESQCVLNGSDADLIGTSRSARVAVLYATQDIATVYAKLGSSKRDVADALLFKFGTRVYHANLSHATNVAAADAIGKIERFHVTETRSRGLSVGGGNNQHTHSGGAHANQGENMNVGEATSAYMDYAVPPDFFATKLRTGGKANRYKVDAIVVRTARTWKSTGKHWVMVEFDQRGRNR